MAIIRFTERPAGINPWAEFDRIRQGLDQFSRNFLTRENAYSGGNVFPALNAALEKDILTIKAELPGVKAEDIDVSFEGETLTVKGKREPCDNGEKISYHRREIETGSFSRAVTLPVKIDPESLAAKLKNGILTITMEIAARAKPRQVTVATE